MTPKTVAIVAMGYSCQDYLIQASVAGGRHKVADEIWGINVMGGVIACDKVFMMDDQEDFREQGKEYEWLSEPGCPIYTSRCDDISDRFVRYPIEDVVKEFKCQYLGNTVHYAIAYAVYLGVKEINLYGVDYNYVDKPHLVEKGRGGAEFWLGIAFSRGIKIGVAENSTLLGTNEPKLYGYKEKPVLSTEEENVEEK
jgi:hypothetical protein